MTELEVMLVHPGGPFWSNKDIGSWSIPKGEFGADENAFAAAKREFSEETGTTIDGNFSELQPVRQKSGKLILAWAVEGDWDPQLLHSNTFDLEWPRGSGQTRTFPEIDRAAWFDTKKARLKIHPGQEPFIDQLLKTLGIPDENLADIGKGEQLDLF